MLNIEQINKIIDNTYDERIAKIFSSKNFEHLLLQKKSVKNKIVIIKKILSKYIIENLLIDKIINDLITTKKLNFIPPGTKSVVKDNYFNWYIKQLLINNLDNQKYFFDFENFSKYTNEKYDFMVINKINNKKIIGMNQLDFWSGGHQVNRAGSYIMKKM